MVTLSNGITVLADEFGLQREYTHKSRKAKIGERIQIVNIESSKHIVTVDFRVGEIFTVKQMFRSVIHTFVERYTNASAAENEYVVLEPTDIVVVDGKRYKTVSRKARIGDRVLITKTDNWYTAGRSFTLHAKAEPFGSGHVNYADGKSGMSPDIYVVLEPIITIPTPQPATPSIPSTDELVTLISKLAADNVKLEKRVVSLEANVAGHERSIGTMDVQLRVAREDIVLVEEGAFDHITAVAKRVSSLEALRTATPTIVNNLTVNGRDEDVARQITEAFRKAYSGPTPKTVVTSPLPTLSRQDVINRAKADVAALEKRMSTMVSSEIPAVKLHGGLIVEYVINRNKRTVAARLRFKFADSSVRETGKCRCAPDDVFNVNIGKAIALRRALGLPVPTEYTKCPQPTEPQIGDIVEFTFHGDVGTTNVTLIEDTRWPKVGTEAHLGSSVGKHGRIVDDSRESETAVTSC